MKPLAIDLFCGLGGWTEGLLAEGYDVIGFDIERHEYLAPEIMPENDEDGSKQMGAVPNRGWAAGRAVTLGLEGENKRPLTRVMRYPGQLVIQDVLTLHGSQFKDAALIVASPPCQAYSWMAMPWQRAKAKAAAIRADETGKMLADLNRLFDACFRIQKEASIAAGRHIPCIVENVRGAIPWVGRSRWNFGSFHLWGDVPALMPMTAKAIKVPTMGAGWYPPDHPKHVPGLGFNTHAERNLREGQKVPGFRFDGSGKSFQSASVEGLKTQGHPNIRDGHRSTGALTRSYEWHQESGIKASGGWSGDGIIRRGNSKSPGRKMASAMIAKIPLPLSRHIASTYFPRSTQI